MRYDPYQDWEDDPYAITSKEQKEKRAKIQAEADRVRLAQINHSEKQIMP